MGTKKTPSTCRRSPGRKALRLAIGKIQSGFVQRRASFLWRFLLVVEIGQPLERLRKDGQTLIFVLGHVTHDAKVSRVIRLNGAFVWADGHIESGRHRSVVWMLEPDTMAATVSVSALDGVIELLKP